MGKKQLDFFKTGLTIGAGIGLASGIAATVWIKNKNVLRADDVLNTVKKAFQKEGPIEGSWITFEKQPVRKFAVHSDAYSGGITRMEDGQLVMYEFLADAKTGTVLDIQRSMA